MNIKAKISGIQHVGIPTNDIQKTILFYEGIGFEIVYQTVNKEADEKVAFMQSGDLIMEIYENKQAKMKSGAIDHIALNVTDIDSIFDYAKEKGYTMLNDKIQFLPF